MRAVIRAAVETGDWREYVAGADELGLLAELAGTTFQFGFSGGDEAQWGLTALAPQELRPVAEALVAAPAAAAWWSRRCWPISGSCTGTAPRGQPGPPSSRQSATACAPSGQQTRNARAGWPRVPAGTQFGMYWWSAPGFAEQTWTTRAAGDIPAAAFGHFIDTLWPFQETGVTVWSLTIAPEARVLEITGPAAWQELVARFPRDVTGTHGGEWRYWGGVPGPWRLPDWELVMEHYDGVHVTVAGFLASCGLALPVGDAYTMLAGWIPGATLWLRDMADRFPPARPLARSPAIRRLGRSPGPLGTLRGATTPGPALVIAGRPRRTTIPVLSRLVPAAGRVAASPAARRRLAKQGYTPAGLACSQSAMRGGPGSGWGGAMISADEPVMTVYGAPGPRTASRSRSSSPPTGSATPRQGARGRRNPKQRPSRSGL